MRTPYGRHMSLAGTLHPSLSSVQPTVSQTAGRLMSCLRQPALDGRRGKRSLCCCAKICKNCLDGGCEACMQLTTTISANNPTYSRELMNSTWRIMFQLDKEDSPIQLSPRHCGCDRCVALRPPRQVTRFAFET